MRLDYKLYVIHVQVELGEVAASIYYDMYISGV